MTADPTAAPLFTCAEAADFERQWFGGDEVREWAAIQSAGRAVASALLADFEEIGGFPADGRILVLAGKGHNAADALIAAHALLAQYPAARAEVVFALGERALRPLTARAWRELAHAAAARVTVGQMAGAGAAPAPDLILDGVFGYQFRPPLDVAVAAWLTHLNARPARLRAAVDVPSGLGEPAAFRADFTYATGSVKTPLLTLPNAGRVRYLDLGFFSSAGETGPATPPATSNVIRYKSLSADSVTPDTCNVLRYKPPHANAAQPESCNVLRYKPPHANAAQPESCNVLRYKTSNGLVLTDAVLNPLRRLRDPHADKRAHGHLLVVAGSRHFPGAGLMTVLAALRSGAGLVTAFVPESLVAAFAARAPEAMWVGWPETARGALAQKGLPALREHFKRATALLIGPGLGREPGTLAVVKKILHTTTLPVVLDADALQPDLVRAGRSPRVLTPHAGEFARIAQGADLGALAQKTGATVVQKGPITRIASGDGPVYHSFFGGPVLARGGSGDILAGLVAGQLAQTPGDLPGAAARGVVWHGRAADLLARAHGPVAVTTTQLLDFLPQVLRESSSPKTQS